MARNLLPDLLFEVFRRCLPSNLSNASATTSPVNLSQVCRSWRDVALENTSLWSYLTLRHDGHGDAHFLKARDAWKLWLERSANAPLTVEIYADRLLDGEEEEAFTDIIEMTFAEQHRWMDVDVWCNSFATGNASSSLCLASSANLRSIALRNHTPLSALPGCSQSEVILDLSKNVQNIRRLSLRGAPSILPVLGFMPNLYSLDIQAHSGISPSSPTLTIQNLFQILSSAPYLSHLSASIIFTAPYSNIQAEVVLSHLRSIDLTVCGFAEQHLFRALTCPALEEFRISFLDEHASSRETWTEIADFIARSRPPLKHLWISCDAIRHSAYRREDELLSLLKHSPTLVSMSLKGLYVSDKLFEALELHPEPLTCNICPDIESVSIVSHRDHEVTVDGVADMVRSRYCAFSSNQATATLRKVILNLGNEELEVNLISMKTYTGDGINVDLFKWLSNFGTRSSICT